MAKILSQQSTESPKAHMIRGAFWAVGSRVLIKMMGFINTVIMARILVPEDYGIVAMGMLTVGFIQIFLEFSATIALLRKKEVTREEIDSAWTLRLMQGVAAGLLIFICSPFAVKYFGEPRLLEVLWTFAACVIFASGSNVGATLALREFDYSVDFKIQTLGKLASILTTIGFGIFLRDYRALTFGIVANYLVPLGLSYAIHSYRPRWNTKKIPEIWRITKWLLLSNVGGFLMRKSDELIAGRIGSTMAFGLYNVGSDLGQLPVAEVGPAMQRAILPTLASIKDDLERTRLAVLKILSSITTVIWPVGLGFAAISTEATELILGDKWLAASPYVAIFAITATLQASCGPFRAFLTLQGYTKVQSTSTWFEFFSFLALAVILVPKHYLLGLAYARVLSSLFNVAYLATVTKLYCQLAFSQIIGNTYRPILTSIGMYFVVIATINVFEAIHLRLVFGILSGATTYALVIMLTWFFSGRPEGLESTIFDRFDRLSIRN